MRVFASHLIYDVIGLTAEGKIIFAREIPEPSTKAGAAGLALAKFGAFMMR
jgi:hypothetical protein